MALNRVLFPLFLQSLAVLVYEIALIRIFSVFMWHHFASLSIALAMLGLAGGGLIVYLSRKTFKSGEIEKYSYRFGWLLALSFLLVYLILFALDLGLLNARDIFSVFQPLNYRPRRIVSDFGLLAAAQLFFIYLLISLPFWALGSYLALLLNLQNHKSFLIYGVNLIGSALGCFLAVPLLNLVSPTRLFLLLAALCGLSVLRQASAHRRGWGALCLVILFFLSLNLVTGDLRLDFSANRFNMPLMKSGWNATSRVAVYQGGANQERTLREISDFYDGAVPSQYDMVINYAGFTRITNFKGGIDELEFTRHQITALGYSLFNQPQVLILGAGGGPEVLLALAQTKEKITAVELNPLVVRYVRDDFADFSGNIYNNPQVEVVVDEARSFLRRNHEKYDLIQASQLYSYINPLAGAFQMSENYLYTVEGFEAYLSHLTDNGVVSFTHLLFPPTRRRIINLALAALRNLGADKPESHIFMASQRGMTTLLIKKTPLSGQDISTLERHASDMGFKVEFSKKLLNTEEVSGRYDLTPPTDERPFFNYLVQPGDFWGMSLKGGGYGYNERVILIIRTVFITILLLALSALILPVFFIRQPQLRWSGLRIFLYFFLIGLGFMMVEIPLLKNLLFILGRPIYSLSVTLFSLLLFGGLGSFSLGWFGQPVFRKAALTLLVLILVLPFYFYFLNLAGRIVIGFTLPLRIVIAVALVAPIGFMMGIPLAAGLSRLPALDRRIPLSWAMNGLGSVLGALASAIFTLNYGFTRTAYLGALCYLVALLAFAYQGEKGWSA